MGALALLVSATLLWPASALAHTTDLAEAGSQPWLLFLLLASAALYAAGVGRLWAQAGRARGIGTAQAGAFAAGWLTLLLALTGPLDALGAQLFCAHMVQHELMMIVAAPLLVLGRPLAAWSWALAPVYRQRIAGLTRWTWLAWLWTRLTQPLVAWALHAVALWAWHVPLLFDAALRGAGVHIAQHASFLGTALLFWWSVLGRDARSDRAGVALVSVFTTMMHTSALGALLTFAPTAWYQAYETAGAAWGLNPVEDQQLGGLVMWVPGASAYLIAGLVLVARLLARAPVTATSATYPVPLR